MLNSFSAWATAVVPKFNPLKKLRAAWGLVGDKDGWLASRSFDLMRTDSTTQWMDDKTWHDLEFPRIFSNLNSTATPLGAQYLYKQLRNYEYDAEIIAARYQAYETLRTDQALREQLQLTLATLDTDAAANIADVLLGPPLQLPQYVRLFQALAISSVLVLVATIVFALSPWFWISVLCVNATVIFATAPKINKETDALKNCGRMLGIADRITNLRTDAQLPQLAELGADRQTRSKLRHDIRGLTLLSGENAFFSALSVVVNLCFLAKLLAYVFAAKQFARSRQQWISTFELIGSIDAAIAVSNFLHRAKNYCRPIVADDARIVFENVYHPLLTDPIKNSITLDKRSALITGSNMAGKTTFIKTIATNIVFGHTLGICLASNAVIPRSSVMASIRGEQSVESGRSRYFSEVHAIMKFIASAASGACQVFVLDEPFSGTNTIERIAIAKAVLNAISEGAQILVTTHDVELQYLLTGNFELFHFQENPLVEGFFDYKLRVGIGSERNAIRVLERMGFPQAIVQDALTHIDKTGN